MTTSTAPAPSPAAELSLTRGGPFFRAIARLHLVTDDRGPWREVATLVAVAWGPVMILALVDALRGASAGPLTDVRVHTALLLGIPLLVLAERVLEERIRSVTGRMIPAGIVPPASADAFRALLARVERLRDAGAPELVLLAGVGVVTVAGLRGALPAPVLRWLAPSLFEVASGLVPWTAGLTWFVLVGQPLFLFLLLRWLWRWGLWGTVVVGLARLRLHLQASHPDLGGGVGFLAHPLGPYQAAVLASSLTLASSWAHEIRHTGARAATFAPSFLWLFVAAFALGLLPYLALAPALLRCRLQGSRDYSLLARRITDRFDARWIHGRDVADDPLERGDFSALTDLASNVQRTEQMKIVPISPRYVTSIFAVVALPAIVAVLLGMPAAEIAHLLLAPLLKL